MTYLYCFDSIVLNTLEQSHIMMQVLYRNVLELLPWNELKSKKSVIYLLYCFAVCC